MSDSFDATLVGRREYRSDTAGIEEAARRLVANDYHGDGGNLINANQQRRADGKLVAAEYLRQINKPQE